MSRIRGGNREPGTGIRVLWLTALLASSVLVADAQHEQHRPPVQADRLPDPGSRLPALGWEPIRCWRQSSAGAVTVGETFTVVLTCAVFESDNAQVVPDESRLGVATIQMAPFEILGGAHPPDVHRGSRRFFQYDYQLRIIGPDAIGHDVNIPPLTVSYRIHSRVGAAATLEGRDLSYVLPMMPIKVLSLVPADASDIRDASEASLGAVESLRFRSSLFRVLTFTLGALAAVMLILALVPLGRSTMVASSAERGRIPDRAVLGRVIADLAEVQARVAGDGWTDEHLSRALAGLRIVSGAAINQAISQKPIGVDGVTPEGRLLVQHGVIRPAKVTVSSSVTADDLDRARARGTSALSTTRVQQLAGLQAGLSALGAGLYRKEPVRDAAEFDEAVRHAAGVAKQLAGERSWWHTVVRQGFHLRQGYGGQDGRQGRWARR
jgi:hypothetical protein